jgi:hypothetical protein
LPIAIGHADREAATVDNAVDSDALEGAPGPIRGMARQIAGLDEPIFL